MPYSKISQPWKNWLSKLANSQRQGVRKRAPREKPPATARASKCYFPTTPATPTTMLYTHYLFQVLKEKRKKQIEGKYILVLTTRAKPSLCKSRNCRVNLPIHTHATPAIARLTPPPSVLGIRSLDARAKSARPRYSLICAFALSRTPSNKKHAVKKTKTERASPQGRKNFQLSFFTLQPCATSRGLSLQHPPRSGLRPRGRVRSVLERVFC